MPSWRKSEIVYPGPAREPRGEKAMPLFLITARRHLALTVISNSAGI
jgi:hypothetical protein